MIIRGGENIQPTKIENYVTTNPKVQDCYVIGVPSRRLGEEVAVFYRMYPLLYHKFGNMLFLRYFLYSLRSPENHNYEKIIYSLIFS